MKCHPTAAFWPSLIHSDFNLLLLPPTRFLAWWFLPKYCGTSYAPLENIPLKNACFVPWMSHMVQKDMKNASAHLFVFGEEHDDEQVGEAPDEADDEEDAGGGEVAAGRHQQRILPAGGVHRGTSSVRQLRPPPARQVHLKTRTCAPVASLRRPPSHPTCIPSRAGVFVQQQSPAATPRARFYAPCPHSSLTRRAPRPFVLICNKQHTGGQFYLEKLFFTGMAFFHPFFHHQHF